MPLRRTARLIDVCPSVHQAPSQPNRLTGRYTTINKAKLVLGVCVALVVVLLGGWLWGASGKGDLVRALEASELRNSLLEARSSILTARLDLDDLNFGEASRHLEDARAQLRRAGERLTSLGRQDDVKQLERAFAGIDEAQRLAGQLDRSANVRAAGAAQIIDEVLGTRR